MELRRLTYCFRQDVHAHGGMRGLQDDGSDLPTRKNYYMHSDISNDWLKSNYRSEKEADPKRA